MLQLRKLALGTFVVAALGAPESRACSPGDFPTLADAIRARGHQYVV